MSTVFGNGVTNIKVVAEIDSSAWGPEGAGVGIGLAIDEQPKAHLHTAIKPSENSFSFVLNEVHGFSQYRSHFEFWVDENSDVLGFFDIQTNGTTKVMTLTVGADGAISFYKMPDDYVSFSTGAAGNQMELPARIRLERSGVATLSSGQASIQVPWTGPKTQVFVTVRAPGGTRGFLSAEPGSGNSWTIKSTSTSESSVVSWMALERP